MTDRPAYLSRTSLAAALDIAESTVDDFVRRGILPAPIDGYAKNPVWSWAAVERTMQALPLANETRSIYVVGFSNYVKIGFTAGPIAYRLAAIQTGCPERLDVIAVIDGSPKDEMALHKRFAAYRTHGEWFRREGDLAEWISAGCPL